MRQKIIMKKELTSENQPYRKSVEQFINLEKLSAEQQKELAWLLWETFHGTIDDLGETPEEMEQEVTAMLNGKYGKFLGEHSFISIDAESGEFQGCGLVSFFREIPLIIYVSVRSQARGKRLSTVILKEVIQSLSQEFDAAYLVVTEGNTIAENIYHQLGFVDVGRDWDTVLNKNEEGE